MVNGGGDMMCILLGAGLVTEGRACDITGTAADISVYVPEPLYDKRLMHLHSVGTDGWIAFGILDAGGGSLRWFKDVFAPEQVREARARGMSPIRSVERAGGRCGAWFGETHVLPVPFWERGHLAQATAVACFSAFAILTASDTVPGRLWKVSLLTSSRAWI